MRTSFSLSKQWKLDNAKYLHDFDKLDDCKSFLAACREFKNIPPLTDATFYEDMLKEYDDKFGSKRTLARKAKAKELQTL